MDNKPEQPTSNRTVTGIGSTWKAIIAVIAALGGLVLFLYLVDRLG